MAAPVTGPQDEDPPRMWIRSVPDVFGVYGPVIEFGEDLSWPLDEATALAHAAAVRWALVTAEYESAVFRQVLAMTEQIETAALVVQDMRARRDPCPPWPGPVELVPQVSVRTGEPFLAVWVEGRAVGQWECATGRLHLTVIAEIPLAARKDQQYLDILLTRVGVAEPVARAAVYNLAEFRTTPPDPETAEEAPTP